MVKKKQGKELQPETGKAVEGHSTVAEAVRGNESSIGKGKQRKAGLLLSQALDGGKCKNSRERGDRSAEAVDRDEKEKGIGKASGKSNCSLNDDRSRNGGARGTSVAVKPPTVLQNQNPFELLDRLGDTPSTDEDVSKTRKSDDNNKNEKATSRGASKTKKTVEASGERIRVREGANSLSSVFDSCWEASSTSSSASEDGTGPGNDIDESIKAVSAPKKKVSSIKSSRSQRTKAVKSAVISSSSSSISSSSTEAARTLAYTSDGSPSQERVHLLEAKVRQARREVAVLEERLISVMKRNQDAINFF